MPTSCSRGRGPPSKMRVAPGIKFDQISRRAAALRGACQAAVVQTPAVTPPTQRRRPAEEGVRRRGAKGRPASQFALSRRKGLVGTVRLCRNRNPFHHAFPPPLRSRCYACCVPRPAVHGLLARCLRRYWAARAHVSLQAYDLVAVTFPFCQFQRNWRQESYLRFCSQLRYEPVPPFTPSSPSPCSAALLLQSAYRQSAPAQ